MRTAEAMVALTVSEAMLRTLPFATVARITGVTAGAPDDGHIPPTSDPAAARVGQAILAGHARLPWHTTCLVRAVAGRLMLRRRRIPSALILGVRRDPEALAAHAWLTVADGVVCGGDEAGKYRPLAVLRGR
jgi:hypothetical protein